MKAGEETPVGTPAPTWAREKIAARSAPPTLKIKAGEETPVGTPAPTWTREKIAGAETGSYIEEKRRR
jgi:hypothetical protein